MAENSEQKKVINVYAVLCASLVMCFIPMATAAGVALMMFLGVWTVAYVLRNRAADDSLIADHMTFIIRTLWAAGFLSIITMAAAIAYLLSVYNPNAIMPCSEGMMSATGQGALELAFGPCMDNFMADNMEAFINAALIGAGPVVVYLAYRITKGLTRAVKGHRIGESKSWF